MRSPSLTRAARAIVGLAVFGTVAVAPAFAKPVLPKRPRALNLFSSAVQVMNVNRLLCPITNTGEVCVDSTLSPVLEGAFWPKGTPDSYIFNSGLQLAGTIPANAGFSWAGDTVGVFFMDPRGDQAEGEGITQVYNSLLPGDAANWPNGAVVRNPTLYNSVLLGRNSISQEDLWVRVWDGNPVFTGSARTHPMGILVEEHGVAWNYPTGNEDIIYFIYTFYNVSASDCTVYHNPTIDPAIADSVCSIGKQFQLLNNAKYGITIPPGGYSVTNLFADFFEDCDVGDASKNYATGNLVFSMGWCWKSDELEPNWAFPGDAFAAPLVAAPGYTAVKYLSSPLDDTGKPIGLTVFSNELNSAIGFPDAVGVKQLYRYISGTASPATGDNPCSLPGVGGTPVQRHWCFENFTPVDIRIFMSSGPFTLKPGQAQTITVAYLQAALTAQVLPFVGGDLKPHFMSGAGVQGLPGDPNFNTASALASVPIEDSIGGWAGLVPGLPASFVVKQDDVVTVPRSLFNKALVAQAVFDSKFLLPFAPQAPQFFLVPGDNQVTVVWEKSGSETVQPGGGNPFFSVASDPTSPLYDPNFRQYDVEGYRIYRGRTSGALQLVAQFDYSGTQIRDFTGSFNYGSNCAPDLGVTDTTSKGGVPGCPNAGMPGFPNPSTYSPAKPGVAVPAADTGVPHDLVGAVQQVPVGGRVVLANGSVLILKADTAVAGGTGGFPLLQDTGVPFAFVDKGVRNSFNYFYAVTAFSVNSLKSGPSSLESSLATKQVSPRASSGQEQVGKLAAVVLLGAAGQALNTSAAIPALDATTGEFAGPMPPTNAVSLGLVSFLPQLLAPGSISLTIDSVVAGFGDPEGVGNGAPALYYLTGKGAGAPVHVVVPIPVDAGSGDNSTSKPFPATALDSAQSARFGGNPTYSLYGSAGLSTSGTWRVASYGRASINGDPANAPENGPRWWAGAANENTPQPNSKVCKPSAGGCVEADLSLNSGAIAGVNIFHVQAYSTVPNVPQRDLEAILSTVNRAADFTVYWGSTAGKVDSVVDQTHHVPVAFRTVVGPSWGILNDSSFVAVPAANTPDGNNGLLTWTDIFCVSPATKFLGKCGGGPAAPLMNHAELSPVAFTASTFGGAAALTTTGNGFIFYLNGHYFLMQMAALPSATSWNVRFYAGNITGSTGSYAFQSADFRNAAVPGLRAQVAYTASTFNPKATNDSTLALVHTVPDPYYVTNALEVTANTKVLKFVHLPAQCIIRIYSVSGVLVQIVTHNDPTGGGEATWNLRNRNNQFVASGVYFYHVEAADGQTKIGRFTVVNFAP